MATDNLPLLHKYVMNRDDDMQLKMTKLRYRLCVREVSDVILARQAGVDLSVLQPPVPVFEETMAAVEAHNAFAAPPQFEEDPSSDPLSSPDSDNPPPSKHGRVHPFADDSGISLDDSSLNQTGDRMNDLPDDDEVVVNGNIPYEEVTTCTLTQDENGDVIVDTGGGPHDDTGIDEDGDGDDGDESSEPDEDMVNGYHPHHTDDEEEEEPQQQQQQQIVTSTPARPVAEPQEEDQEAQESPVRATVVEHYKPQEGAESEDNQPGPQSSVTVIITSVPESTDPEESEGGDRLAEQSREDSPQDSTPEPEVEEATPEVTQEDDDAERVDFIMGTKCEDVWTAIDILKTRYRLSSVLDGCFYPSPGPFGLDSTTTVKKCIITWSRWNLQDVVREPSEAMPWWAKTREPEPVINEMDEVIDMATTIQNKEAEISDLLQSVLDEERKQKDVEPKKKEATPPGDETTPPGDETTPPAGGAPSAQPEDEVVECKEEPPLETIPEAENEAPEDDKAGKKKKRNLFSRMMRALRKRLSTRGRA